MEFSSIQTRPSSIEDVDALHEIMCEFAKLEGEKLSPTQITKENLKKYGFGKIPFFYVELAENEQGIVGYALYSYSYSGRRGVPFLYLEHLYVSPSARGKGIGTLLLKKLASYAKSNDCTRIELHTFGWNDKAVSFYESLGGVERKDLLLIRIDKEAYLKWLDTNANQ